MTGIRGRETIGKMRQSLLPLIGVLVFGGVVVVVYNATKDEPVAPQKAAPPAPEPATPNAATDPPLADVMIPKLIDDYQANEVAGDSLYKGKVIRVTGLVARVSVYANEPQIYFVYAGGRKALQAGFASDHGVAALKPNDRVSARCVCKGLFGYEPILDGCVLE